MSAPSTKLGGSRRLSKTFFVCVALLLTTSVGCWEQWSVDWFPQMKWQKAVQAFEAVRYDGQIEGFVPPEGTVPIDGGEAPVSGSYWYPWRNSSR